MFSGFFYSILPKLKTNKVFEDLIGFAPGQAFAYLSWRLLFRFHHRIGEWWIDPKPMLESTARGFSVAALSNASPAA
jgi:hypothetical protein